jgi:uncharacterized protein YkwD
LRKLLVTILAVPVLVSVYAASALGRSRFIRGGAAIGLGAVLAFGAMSAARPPVATADPVHDIVPLTQAAFTTAVGTKVPLAAPATITFTTPMQRASVEAALMVAPSVDVRLEWSAGDTVLAVAPARQWAASTYYTITVGPGALATNGRPMTAPVRAAFLTRAATSVVLAATVVTDKRVAPSSAFTVTFDQPVDPASVDGAIRLEPATAATLTSATGPDGRTTYTLTPTAPLAPDARYRLIVDGVRDAGGSLVSRASLAVRTARAPSVVRFRPAAGLKDVAKTTAISVRFTRPMDRAATRKAFAVTANGKPVAGAVRFAENDTVLVFDPKADLPDGATVVAKVAATARSRDGVGLAAASKATFTTVAKKKPVVRTTAIKRPSGSGTSGGTVGSGSWSAVERYYLGLMNCTRTGGWVTSGGGCSSPGGRNVAALRLDSGISSKVSRPYAKKLAVNNMCTHFSGGTPGDRLRHAGYTSYKWAENLGCRSGNPYSAVLGSHLFFQSERAWTPDGGHYVNLMNSLYDRVGIGVWVSGGRVRLVVDFYHP